jgi:hypothetical protein
MRTFSSIALVGLLFFVAPGATAAEPFSQSVCWDAKCPDEVAACQAHGFCTLIAECIQDGEAVITCFNDVGSETGADLYKAIQECGWASCATTEGSCDGVCSYFGPTVCNCDPLCETYGDCCEDYWDLCWVEPEVCLPKCIGKSCGDDGCEGVCGTCPPNAVCDATGACNDQCEDVCLLGESGCDGDVSWTCTPGPGGCPKKTTLDCSGAQMICDHGGCVEPPPTPDVVAPDGSIADVAPETASGDIESPDEGELGPEIPSPDVPEPAQDIAPETAEEAEITDAAGEDAGLPTTQTASAPKVVRQGCGGGPPSTAWWSILAAAPWLVLRRRRLWSL